jgi:hypothetical protein
MRTALKESEANLQELVCYKVLKSQAEENVVSFLILHS